MATVSKISPCIWFDGQADDAAAFYTKVFDDARILRTLSYSGDNPMAGQTMLVDFELEHGAVRIDPAARAPRHTRIEKDRDVWRVEQTLLDAEDAGDFFVDARIDLPRSRDEGDLVIELRGIRRA